MTVGFNRAQRRAAEKVERQTGGILVDQHHLKQLVDAQRMLLAIVKEQGRVRVSEETLASLREGDTIKGKLHDGAVTLTFDGAPAPEAA